MLRKYYAHGLRALVGCGAMLLLATSAAAEEATVVLVEEYWELHVDSTDSNSTAPQVATVFSPTGNVDGVHAVFEINHQSEPEFVAGGLHLQLWSGEYSLATGSHEDHKVMSSGSEVVKWKQTIKLEEGELTFSIDAGSSSTWNHFGGRGKLTTSTSTNLESLNGYDPDVSVEHSGVVYAGNRVGKLVLKKVRIVGEDGNDYVDSSPRVVHEQP